MLHVNLWGESSRTIFSLMNNVSEWFRSDLLKDWSLDLKHIANIFRHDTCQLYITHVLLIFDNTSKTNFPWTYNCTKLLLFCHFFPVTFWLFWTPISVFCSNWWLAERQIVSGMQSLMSRTSQAHLVMAFPSDVNGPTVLNDKQGQQRKIFVNWNCSSMKLDLGFIRCLEIFNFLNIIHNLSSTVVFSVMKECSLADGNDIWNSLEAKHFDPLNLPVWFFNHSYLQCKRHYIVIEYLYTRSLQIFLYVTMCTLVIFLNCTMIPCPQNRLYFIVIKIYYLETHFLDCMVPSSYCQIISNSNIFFTSSFSWLTITVPTLFL